MVVEICANSLTSAINAEKAGAHRIELCTELAVGGVTPSYGLLKRIMEVITIPVHVLIRPRSGDFTYSDREFDIMKEDIELCKKLGCAGIVSGVLLTDNSIDIKRTQTLVNVSYPMSFTFHRAFDWVRDPLSAIEILARMGIDRVLTSGQEISAEKGIELLKQLKEKSTVSVLPGGGVNIQNIHLFKSHGFDEVHLSASTQSQTITTPKVAMNSLKLFDETKIVHSDFEKIKNILQKINNEA